MHDDVNWQHSVESTAPGQNDGVEQLSVVEKNVCAKKSGAKKAHAPSVVAEKHAGSAEAGPGVPQHAPKSGSANVGKGVGAVDGAGVGASVGATTHR